MHVDFRIPDGWLEGVLAALFVVTAGSGIAGAVLNRVLARRLAGLDEEVLYERIPGRRNALRERAEAIVLEWAEARGEASLVDLGQRRVLPFLARGRDGVGHVLGVSRSGRRLVADLASRARYLDEASRPALAELSAIVAAKDDLDRHLALQSALRAWLFVHVPATWSMWVLVACHAVVAHLYHGGLR